MTFVPTFAFFNMGPPEMIVIGIVAVLLFGKNLPEVGRSIGRSLIEFKKGMRGIEDEIQRTTNFATSDFSSSSSAPSSNRRSTFSDIDDRDEATAPKFDPPRAEPKAS